MSLLKIKKQLIATALAALMAVSTGGSFLTLAAPQVQAASTDKGSITLDTAQYIMAPGNRYDIGAFIKDPTGKQLTPAEIKTLVSQGKLKVSDSRSGSIVNLEQLSSGHFRVTGRKTGTCYIVYDIGGTHASVRIDVQNGVKQHGTAVRNTSIFIQNVFSNPASLFSDDMKRLYRENLLKSIGKPGDNYALYDIDKNGIPEVIFDSSGKFFIYSVSVSQNGEINTRYCGGTDRSSYYGFYEYDGNGIIIVNDQYAYYKDDYVDLYTLTNGRLTDKPVRLMDTENFEDKGKGMDKIQEFLQGYKRIKFYALDDYEPLYQWK